MLMLKRNYMRTFRNEITYVRPPVRPEAAFKECNYHIKDGFRYSDILEKNRHRIVLDFQESGQIYP